MLVTPAMLWRLASGVVPPTTAANVVLTLELVLRLLAPSTVPSNRMFPNPVEIDVSPARETVEKALNRFWASGVGKRGENP